MLYSWIIGLQILFCACEKIAGPKVSQKFRFLLVSLLPTNLISLVVAAFDGHVKDLVWAFGQTNFVYLRWIEIFLRYYFSL